jgi:hypothetical protein
VGPWHGPLATGPPVGVVVDETNNAAATFPLGNDRTDHLDGH